MNRVGRGRIKAGTATVVKTMSHNFKCEKTRVYLSINVGVQRVYGIKSLLGDHYLWSDHKKRNRILAQFAAASFFIAEIMRCRLHGNKLSW